MIWHHGQTGGSSSLFALLPERAGIVVANFAKSCGTAPHCPCVDADESGTAVINASLTAVPTRREYDPRS
jgi:hypothetical protein